MGLATSIPPLPLRRRRPRSVANRMSSKGIPPRKAPSIIGSRMARMRGSRSRSARLSRCVSCRLRKTPAVDAHGRKSPGTRGAPGGRGDAQGRGGGRLRSAKSRRARSVRPAARTVLRASPRDRIRLVFAGRVMSSAAATASRTCSRTWVNHVRRATGSSQARAGGSVDGCSALAPGGRSDRDGMAVAPDVWGDCQGPGGDMCTSGSARDQTGLGAGGGAPLSFSWNRRPRRKLVGVSMATMRARRSEDHKINIGVGCVAPSSPLPPPLPISTRPRRSMRRPSGYAPSASTTRSSSRAPVRTISRPISVSSPRAHLPREQEGLGCALRRSARESAGRHQSHGEGEDSQGGGEAGRREQEVRGSTHRGAHARGDCR
jgi:hypothetical protein